MDLPPPVWPEPKPGESITATYLPPPPKPDLAAPTIYEYTVDQLREFGESCARMAREEERERCAQIAEGNYEAKTFGLTPSTSQAGQIAAAIRNVHPQDFDRHKAIEQARAFRKAFRKA